MEIGSVVGWGWVGFERWSIYSYLAPFLSNYPAPPSKTILNNLKPIHAVEEREYFAVFVVSLVVKNYSEVEKCKG